MEADALSSSGLFDMVSAAAFRRRTRTVNSGVSVNTYFSGLGIQAAPGVVAISVDHATTTPIGDPNGPDEGGDARYRSVPGVCGLMERTRSSLEHAAQRGDGDEVKILGRSQSSRPQRGRLAGGAAPASPPVLSMQPMSSSVEASA
jgi:hypothetical protein